MMTPCDTSIVFEYPCILHESLNFLHLYRHRSVYSWDIVVSKAMYFRCLIGETDAT